MRITVAAGLAALAVSAGSAHAQSGRSAFDGNWSVTITCDPSRDAAGYRIQFGASVHDGVLHGEMGMRGDAGSLALDGQIKPDGTALLRADGLTGDPRTNVGRVPQLQPVHYSLETQFAGDHGVGHRIELRPCTAVFAKQ